MQKVALFIKRFLPSPFSIALLLTGFTWLLAIVYTRPETTQLGAYTADLLKLWAGGMWGSALLAFAFQMMLMLVLGHVLALSKPVNAALEKLANSASSGAIAAALVTFVAVLVGFFNWGLALIVGAVFARKMGDHALKNNLAINYPIIGASGYAGMLVFHGGISGSALIKVAEENHLKTLMGSELASLLPGRITFDYTVFSPMNVMVSFALLVFLPLVMYSIAKKAKHVPSHNPTRVQEEPILFAEGADKLDHTPFFNRLFGASILLVIGLLLIENGFLGYFSPNRINLLLLALCLIAHQSISALQHALAQAIVGAAGILVQFPLYFGVMAVFTQTGLMSSISNALIANANEITFPIFTFFSAALVNLFVPSGGGQWIVQGPLIIETALALKVDLGKSILALAYGDQLTNMLQPFWALPLLGMTGLRAKEILPYTLILFIVAAVIFISALLLF